jgi:hypothetical protein
LSGILLHHSCIPPRPCITPDAFIIDRQNHTVACDEVEDTNPIGKEKRQPYRDTLVVLDEVYWGLCLVIGDRSGNHAKVFDVSEMVVEEIMEEVKPSETTDPDWVAIARVSQAEKTVVLIGLGRLRHNTEMI